MDHAAWFVDCSGCGYKSLSGNLATEDSLAIFVW
jgi:hypothetical protein